MQPAGRGREPPLWREISLSSTSKVRSKQQTAAAAPLGPVTGLIDLIAAAAGAEPVSHPATRLASQEHASRARARSRAAERQGQVGWWLCCGLPVFERRNGVC